MNILRFIECLIFQNPFIVCSIVFRISCENDDDSEREVNKDFTAALSMLQLALYRLLTGKRLAPWKRTGTDSKHLDVSALRLTNNSLFFD
jgi:hypothetical protein